MAVSAGRLRQIRDQVLVYVYENGASAPQFSVDADEIKQALGLSREEMSQVAMLMHNQGLMAQPGIVGMIGLSERGQAEAERLGPDVLMRDQSESHPSITINASYSTVQIAGANSRQSATNTVNADDLTELLHRIEAQLPKMSLPDEKKSEAKGLVDSLRSGLAAGMAASGMRAMGAALAGLLSDGGSDLGEGLQQNLQFSLG